MMDKVFHYAGQIVAYTLFAATIGYLATSPTYTYMEPGLAIIKLSFSHPGEHSEACRRLTQEELNALPPNMRQPTSCPRQRIALQIELELDGEIIYRDALPPSGLAGDGASTAYKKFTVSTGKHHIIARLRDSRDTDGFDYEKAAEINLSPQQNFVIDFRPEKGGFLFM